uniref:Circumsporozoite protein-like n=1 Tax=Castor canadensis TaxID=51338 RepID=A0A8B7UTL2_CASCN|nr:circumsporozoite protein-like [Castor canadensis]
MCITTPIGSCLAPATRSLKPLGAILGEAPRRMRSAFPSTPPLIVVCALMTSLVGAAHPGLPMGGEAQRGAGGGVRERRSRSRRGPVLRPTPGRREKSTPSYSCPLPAPCRPGRGWGAEVAAAPPGLDGEERAGGARWVKPARAARVLPGEGRGGHLGSPLPPPPAPCNPARRRRARDPRAHRSEPASEEREARCGRGCAARPSREEAARAHTSFDTWSRRLRAAQPGPAAGHERARDAGGDGAGRGGGAAATCGRGREPGGDSSGGGGAGPQECLLAGGRGRPRGGGGGDHGGRGRWLQGAGADLRAAAGLPHPRRVPAGEAQGPHCPLPAALGGRCRRGGGGGRGAAQWGPGQSRPPAAAAGPGPESAEDGGEVRQRPVPGHHGVCGGLQVDAGDVLPPAWSGPLDVQTGPEAGDVAGAEVGASLPALERKDNDSSYI